MATTARSYDRPIALALGLGVVVIWGLSFPATRVAVAELPPMTLALVRFAIALAVLAPWIRRDLGAAWRGPDRWGFFLVGFTGVTLAFAFENWGLSLTTASHGSLIVATTPLATAITEAALERRLPAGRTIAGLLLALAGTVVIVAGPDEGGATLLGDLLMVCTVAVWVVYSFQVRRLADRHPVSRVTNLAILWGVVTLLPPAALEAATRDLSPLSATGWVAVAFLGVGCSAVAYLWWNRALAVLGVTTTNSLIYGIPLVAVAAGVLWLDEPLTAEILIGGAMILGGVLLANLRRLIPGELTDHRLDTPDSRSESGRQEAQDSTGTT